MSLTAEHQRKIDQMLTIEIQCADQMRLILEQEHDALLHRESEEIHTIALSKNNIKNQMQKHLQQRDRFLKSLALAGGNRGTQTLINHFPGRDAEKSWHKLTNQALQLKEMNDINGGIVSLSLKSNRLALDILTGQTPGNETYGPGGQSRKGAFHQTLAKA